MPGRNLRSMTSYAGSIGIIPIFAASEGSRKRLRLIKRVFPRIASLCRQRHIAFTEVDLR